MEFITDRSAADVARWKALHDKGWAAMTEAERTEWMAGLKGAYKHTDMNRVESAVLEFMEEFKTLGVDLSLTVETGWTRTRRPTVSDMRRYFGNVAALRAATGVRIDAPATPTVNSVFDYQKANDLEKILEAIGVWLRAAKSATRYSGEIYLGEV